MCRALLRKCKALRWIFFSKSDVSDIRFQIGRLLKTSDFRSDVCFQRRLVQTPDPKSDVRFRKALHVRKRAIYVHRRAIRIHKTALHMCKRALHTYERALHLVQTPDLKSDVRSRTSQHETSDFKSDFDDVFKIKRHPISEKVGKIGVKGIATQSVGALVCVHVCVCVCVTHTHHAHCGARLAAGLQSLSADWRGCVGCLVFIRHFPQNSPVLRGSFAERDLQLWCAAGSGA